MTYSLTPEAEAELAEAVEFYALNVSARVAANFLALIEEKAQLLTKFPGLGAPTTKGRRLLPIGRYPYSLLYLTVEATSKSAPSLITVADQPIGKNENKSRRYNAGFLMVVWPLRLFLMRRRSHSSLRLARHLFPN